MPKIHKNTKYPYHPRYCDEIIEFFSPPYYTIKDMTITKPDGTKIDKTEMEALPPLFLSDFARILSAVVLPIVGSPLIFIL